MSMRDVYIDTLGELKSLYPILNPCMDPSKTIKHGYMTYTLFNSIEENFTIESRVWRIAKAIVAVVVGIFPGFSILFMIPSYRDWIAESWNEGYTGIEKISIYVLPTVLEEFNKKEMPETEKSEEEEVSLSEEFNKKEAPETEKSEEEEEVPSLEESNKKEVPETEKPAEEEVSLSEEFNKKEVLETEKLEEQVSLLSEEFIKKEVLETKKSEKEVSLSDATKPEPRRQAPSKSHTDSPMKRPYVGPDYPKNRSTQRTLFESNNPIMSTRPTTHIKQVTVVESHEAISDRLTNLALNPPQGCSKKVQDKLIEISVDMLDKESFNVDAVKQIFAIDLLAPNALKELDEYHLAL